MENNTVYPSIESTDGRIALPLAPAPVELDSNKTHTYTGYESTPEPAGYAVEHTGAAITWRRMNMSD
jgi:hypothetical protein